MQKILHMFNPNFKWIKFLFIADTFCLQLFAISLQATCFMLSITLRTLRRFHSDTFPSIMLIFNVKNSIHYDEIASSLYTCVRHYFVKSALHLLHNQSSIICGLESCVRCVVRGRESKNIEIDSIKLSFVTVIGGWSVNLLSI